MALQSKFETDCELSFENTNRTFACGIAVASALIASAAKRVGELHDRQQRKVYKPKLGACM